MTYDEAAEILRLAKLVDEDDIFCVNASKFLNDGDIENFEAVCRAYHKWLKENKVTYILTDGVARIWHSDYMLMSYDAVYKNSMLNGVSRCWYANGQMASDCVFKNGKLNGLYRKWMPDGRQIYEAEYKDGNLNGMFRSFDLDGSVYSELLYKDSKLVRSKKRAQRSPRLCCFSSGFSTT